MRKTRIPTIIGLIILVIGLATGVYLIGNRQLFKLGATGENTPRDVRLANFYLDSFTVSWLSDTATAGFVTYGERVSDLTSVQKEEGTTPAFTHLVKLTNLKPETTYYLKINSGGSEYDNNGIYWQGRTVAVQDEAADPFLVSGSVLTTASSPPQSALVYINIGSNLFAAATSTNGSYLVPLLMPVEPANTLLEIAVQAGPEGIATAQIYPQSAKPVPTLVLGQTYDFKNLPPSTGSELPQASYSTPDENNPSSGFNLPENGTAPPATTVTLESIDNGEIINTTKPELLGKGPAGTKITITIESDPVAGETTIPPSGEWNWEVPQDLPPGVHTVTINWHDAAGILRTLIRTFVVQASEGPAFEATPSATPTLRPITSPTATPLRSPSGQATVSPTPLPPQPESGALTPTLLLSIMGVGLISFGFIFWKEANARPS